MKELPYEHCSICDALTDKAGQYDDSIFCEVIKDGVIEGLEIHEGDEIGPLCDACYDCAKKHGLVLVED